MEYYLETESNFEDIIKNLMVGRYSDTQNNRFLTDTRQSRLKLSPNKSRKGLWGSIHSPDDHKDP